MLATVASSTSANRIKRYLIQSGFDAAVIQTPGALTKEGCGYSIRIDDSLKKETEKAASELGISIRAFYREVNEANKRKYIRIRSDEQ